VAQAGLWLSHHLDPAKRAATLAEYVEIHGPVDVALLETAWRVVCAETDAWRIRVAEEAGEPALTIADSVDGHLPMVDVSGQPSPEAAAGEWMADHVARPIELSDGSVAAFAILKLADDRFFWYQRFHHLVIDYYGVVMCTRRIAEVYTALVQRTPYQRGLFGRLPAFLDELAAYRRSTDYEADRMYWLGRLADLPEPPTLGRHGDLGRHSGLGRHGGADAGPGLIRTTFLPEPELALMRDVARKAGTGWSRLMMATTAAYLHRMTGDGTSSWAYPWPAERPQRHGGRRRWRQTWCPCVSTCTRS
jgi:Condensation domain